MLALNHHEQRNSYQVAQLLKEFWEKADKSVSRLGRLALLRKYERAELVGDPFANVDPNNTRGHFQKQKAKGRFRLQGWCWVCRNETSDHRHHVIPLKAGGRNRRDNLVNLCVRCHRDVHARQVASE